MALIGNYSALNKDPGRSMAGPSVSDVRSNFSKAGTIRGRFYNGFNNTLDKTGAIPNGYLAPYCWSLPQYGGGMATYVNVAGASVISAANLAGGVGIAASLTGAGAISTALLTVNVAAAAAGTGVISTANLTPGINGSIEIDGIGSISADITAPGDMSCSLSGSGSISVGITATADLASSIDVAGGSLTTVNVADAVWGAISEGVFTYAEVMQLIAAAAAAKTSNDGQTLRDLSDTKDRITGTVTGQDRTAASYNFD